MGPVVSVAVRVLHPVPLVAVVAAEVVGGPSAVPHLDVAPVVKMGELGTRVHS